MKTVLVTGGCGFIGSQFVRLLLAKTGWRVLNLDKLTYAGNLENLRGLKEGACYRFIKEDIGNLEQVDKLFQEEQPSMVVNFAAESHVDRSIMDASPFLQTNVFGVHVLIEVSRRYGVEKFVQISTDEVYGDVQGKEPRSEESQLEPSSPYSASKAAADLLCLASRRTYGIPVVIVRSSNNYGPFQFPEKLIPLMIRNALIGEDLPVYGDGLQERDWVYVEDNVDAIFRVLQGGDVGAIYNVGNGEERTNLDVVRSICQIVSEEAGLDLQTLLGRIQLVTDRPGHDRRYALKAQKIIEGLGWHPGFSFEKGLRRTVRWYLDNQEWIERVTSGEYMTYYENVYLRAWRHTS
jgi:dTDP-glucose 4,6-dehydratase